MANVQKRLLAVFAHPDDETFICGGTLAGWTAQGGEITLLCATRGEMGRRMGNPPFATRESLADLRDVELRNACAALGIRDLRLLGLWDKLVEYTDMDWLVGRVVAAIRELKPELLVGFHPEHGGHPDHCAMGLAAQLAFQRAADPAWYPEAGSPYQVPAFHAVAWQPMVEKAQELGLDPARCLTVNVNRHKGQKLAAFRAHRSQIELSKDIWLPDEQAKRKLRGKEYFYVMS